jgi:alkylation response protein AidB-like acyl-CoA dehydrogenase
LAIEAIYQPTLEQRSLAGDFVESLADLLPIGRLRTSDSETEATWQALDQLGLFGMTAREAAGGSGVGAAEEAMVIAGLGRCLASPSVLASLAAVHADPSSFGSGRALRVMAAFARQGIVAIDDPFADTVLIRTGGHAALHAVERRGRPIDSQLWLGALIELETPSTIVGTFDAAALARLRLIDAAALAGLAEAACAMAVDYAKVREQFGRAIGSFQAVKHHCANMAIAARSALDLVTFAASAIDEGRDDAAILADSAFVIAASAAIDNAGKNIQIHGGIGFSEEADPHLFLKRAQLQVAIGGGIEAAIARLSEAGLNDVSAQPPMTGRGAHEEAECRLS